MFVLKHTKPPVNSVLKILVDLFSIPETTNLFYTNDIKVLIDILVRQLSDLCAGDPVSLCAVFDPLELFILICIYFELPIDPQMVPRTVPQNPKEHRLCRTSTSCIGFNENFYENLLRRDSRVSRRSANCS